MNEWAGGTRVASQTESRVTEPPTQSQHTLGRPRTAHDDMQLPNFGEGDSEHEEGAQTQTLRFPKATYRSEHQKYKTKTTHKILQKANT